MKECILITGGAGFIGCAVSKQLSGSSLPIVAFDNLHPQIHPDRTRPADLPEHVALFRGDVSTSHDWEALLAEYRPVSVIHLAAETGTGQSLTESVRHAQVNVVGTAQMLDAFSRHSIKPAKIVLSSSRAVYGEGGWRRSDGSVFYPGQRDSSMLSKGQWDYPDSVALPFQASQTQPHPASIYAATKLTQEHMLASWCDSFGVDYTILRLQNVYGPGQSLSNPYTGIVPLFARIAKKGESIPLYEDGAMLRDFVFIDDVAAAIRTALTSDTASRKILDIGSGRSISIAELAGIVAGHYGAPVPHVCGLFRNGDVRHAACATDEAVAALEWKPVVMPEEGVSRLCGWIDGRLGS
jgi:dTDP-L-rhamnose 4-epimerase